MKRLILSALAVVIAAFTACENDMFNDAFTDVKPSVKYYGYVTTTNSLYSYEVLEDGSFQQIGAPFTGLPTPTRIAVHPSGDFIYVAANQFILCYKTGDDGSLTPLAPLGSPFTDFENVAVHPSGRYLYATRRNARNIYAYTIQQNGSLIHNSTIMEAGDVTNHGIAVNPSGTMVFVGKYKDSEHRIYSYTVDNNGTLTEAAFLPATDGVRNIIVHPSGNYLYCGTSGTIRTVQINSDGSLTQIDSLGTSDVSTDISLHPSGKYLYGTSLAGLDTQPNSFVNFGILNQNMALVEISQPLDITDSKQGNIAVHPNGKYVYITNKFSAHSSLICYSADEAGSLSYNTMTAKTAELPVDVEICAKTVYGEN